MFLAIGTHALRIMIMLSAPLLLVALAVGLLVGVFQAATQINEMTLVIHTRNCWRSRRLWRLPAHGC